MKVFLTFFLFLYVFDFIFEQFSFNADMVLRSGFLMPWLWHSFSKEEGNQIIHGRVSNLFLIYWLHVYLQCLSHRLIFNTNKIHVLQKWFKRRVTEFTCATIKSCFICKFRWYICKSICMVLEIFKMTKFWI